MERYEFVLVSSCLVGLKTRWHGKKVSFSSFVKKFIKQNPYVILVVVCPELLGGLSVPRSPVKRRKDRVWETCAEKKDRKNVTGKELTKEFEKGANSVLKIVKDLNISKAILCKFSPSCDKTGICGKLLSENNIEVINTW